MTGQAFSLSGNIKSDVYSRIAPKQVACAFLIKLIKHKAQITEKCQGLDDTAYGKILREYRESKIHLTRVRRLYRGWSDEEHPAMVSAKVRADTLKQQLITMKC